MSHYWFSFFMILFADVPLTLAGEPVDYQRQIKPVLQARCYACHGALKQKAGLRLDTVQLMLKGSKAEPAIIAGNAEGSPLLSRILATEEGQRMPPEGEPLKPKEIAAIRAWITHGAKAPAEEIPEGDPSDHWAFKRPIRHPVPGVKNRAWSGNPIDAFLAREQEKRGVIPQPLADRRVWLRRVTLDLIGLPPTLEQIDAFVADQSPDAYEKVVDRLLASPQYGERWGRHWMDIWRYSDWWGLGDDLRNSQKHIWHWRDWIIESLNTDKGYDQMIREMLAADELYPNDMDRLRGTGFLARQYFKFNRTTWLDETIEHTSKAFLGLTTNCAKCHDHKYDPITQRDYYRFRAIFEPYQVRTDVLPGETDLQKDGLPRPFDCNVDAVTHLHIRGDDRRPDTSVQLDPGLPAFLGSLPFEVAMVKLPPEAYQPGLRPFVVGAQLQDAEKKVRLAEQAVMKAKTDLEEAEKSLLIDLATLLAPIRKLIDKKPVIGVPVFQARSAFILAGKTLQLAQIGVASLRARIAADHVKYRDTSNPELSVLVAAASRAERAVVLAAAEELRCRADLELLLAIPTKKVEAEKKVQAAITALETARKALDQPGTAYTSLIGASKSLESPTETEQSRLKAFPIVSTGRRTALARWLTDRNNPLPARVAVNHLWLRHFGSPLVPSIFDFGRKGTPPTHPELLDWLAVELMEHGWSQKHLHRLMVTSRAYQLASITANAAPASKVVDPENLTLWHANSRRLEAEVVRDTLLALAGELDLTRGGPPIPVGEENSRRRSLYFVHSHNEHAKFLALFDGASVLECYRRSDSILPQQALALENSPLAARSAEKIAQRIETAHTRCNDRDFVRFAHILILATEPNPAEQALLEETIAQMHQLARTRGETNASFLARSMIVLALLNHNDFVTLR